VNDGACALLLASRESASRHGLVAKARVVAMATSGLAPRIMGYGPVEATRKVLALSGLALDDMDVIELNEAFAAQSLAVTRALGLADDAPQVNPNGGAIALGHPLGMSGARLMTTALHELQRREGRYAIAVTDLESGLVRTLTEGPLDESPAFSPNGAMVLYSSSSGGRPALATVSVHGRAGQPLQSVGEEVREPAWSPSR